MTAWVVVGDLGERISEYVTNPDDRTQSSNTAIFMSPINGTLPPLVDVLSSTANPDDALANALSILFEPSPILFSGLVPQLASTSKNYSSITTTYRDIIRAAITIIADWDENLRSKFIVGHPRIGESENLSNLSAKEQGAAVKGVVSVTSPEVLARLEHLNACYERRYPGLRYITFVNGRSRATIAMEMEDCLGIEHSLSSNEPPLDTFKPVLADDMAWRAELDRAIVDVGRIAESRLSMLGVE